MPPKRAKGGKKSSTFLANVINNDYVSIIFQNTKIYYETKVKKSFKLKQSDLVF